MVSEAQLFGVEVGFGTFGAVSDALSLMVNALESKSVQLVDQQGVIPSRVLPVPDGVAVEVANKQRRSGRQEVNVPVDNLVSDALNVTTGSPSPGTSVTAKRRSSVGPFAYQPHPCSLPRRRF